MTVYHAAHPSRDARPFGAADVVLRAAIVGLALGTAYIHSTLGGALFTLNAIGYLVFAVAMVVPFRFASRSRWMVRIGLAGYAASTILGWAIQGPFYTTAYIAKGIEVALIALLTVDFVRFDGNPLALTRRAFPTGFARLRRLAAAVGLAALVGVIVAACAGTSSPTAPTATIGPNALVLAAKDLSFSTTELTTPAGKPFQIAFDNQDGAPHNVAIHRDPSASEKVFDDQPFAGPHEVIYDVPALTPGSYLFRCDVHPDMKGTLTVL